MTAILVYGKLQKEKAKTLTKLPVGDISYAGWRTQMEEQIGHELEEWKFLCTQQAYMIARKHLPAHTVQRIDSLEEVALDSEKKGPKQAAARIGDMVVSKQFHPAVTESKAWLSTYHIDLIKELFQEGFVIEILDEQNKPVATLGETE